MTHRIHVTADRHEEPDLDQFVAALLAWALTEVAEDDESEGDSGSTTHDESRKEGDD